MGEAKRSMATAARLSGFILLCHPSVVSRLSLQNSTVATNVTAAKEWVGRTG
jgi:hypothetical protein